MFPSDLGQKYKTHTESSLCCCPALLALSVPLSAEASKGHPGPERPLAPTELKVAKLWQPFKGFLLVLNLFPDLCDARNRESVYLHHY